ncbi:NUDIX domain-containing protein [Streptomyces rubiginosohelvolus]|uniref:NUDIX domain-containing protein n=1 Tax=Streptomyces rubiginosohelvolus TaxID=67362 RepID=UPI00364B28DA
MKMKQRVRAILITTVGTTLLMKRVRPGRAAYWVVIGGGVEDSDATREEALLREIREEIAGTAEILRPLHQLVNRAGETEHFYVARVTQWSFDDRSGPEFQKEDRGEYILDEIPLTRAAIRQLNLLPEEISTVLCETLDRGELLSSP